MAIWVAFLRATQPATPLQTHAPAVTDQSPSGLGNPGNRGTSKWLTIWTFCVYLVWTPRRGPVFVSQRRPAFTVLRIEQIVKGAAAAAKIQTHVTPHTLRGVLAQRLEKGE